MKNVMKLSPQAVGAIMLAVQKGIYAITMDKPAEECDITKLLLDLELEVGEDQVFVINPPVLEVDNAEV